MTDLPTVTMCDALADNLRDGGHYACFRRPHEDPWHFDNRGLGVSFRIDPHGLTAVVGVLPENADAYIAAHQDGLGGGNSSPDPADWDTGEVPRMTEAFAAFSSGANLPAPLGGPAGLDVDSMRVLAPQVRQGLIDALRSSATSVRAGRGTVVVPEDTYDLVRRLTAAQEVLTQWGQAFTAAAKEAAAIIEEEAMTVAGSEQDGVLTSSLFVPDGSGQRIAVRADWKSGESTWDVPSLIGWLAEDTVAAEGRGGHEQVYPDANERAFTEAEVIQLAREAMDRLLTLGKFTPYAKQVEALRKKLAEQQRDSDAAVIRQVRTVGPRQYQGVKITREEAP